MRSLFFILFAAAALVLSGCVAVSPAEQSARARVQAAAATLRPEGRPPPLPVLRPDTPPGEFVRYAVLNHPAVAAAYHDWHATVEAIAPARALPDPQFTFEADIADTLMTFMPGLMFDIMTPGKRAAMGREMTAGSEVAYRTFTAIVLRTAADVQQAWIELAYAGEARRLYLAAITTLEQALALTDADYATGRMMASLEPQVRLQNQIAEHHSHHQSLNDRIAAARVRFKAALGLAPADADPPWPQATLFATPLPDEQELWRQVQTANPQLAQMRAMVEMAVAGVAVARKTATPDFALGFMADLRANPLMIRPTANVSLPVWREKIAATIASAEARHAAAAARVTAEQLNLAAGLARMLYMVRESERMLAYIDGTALPNFARMSATAEAAYQSGAGEAGMITEARHMADLMRLERLEVLRQREVAAIGLLLLSADLAPAGFKAEWLKN